MLADINCHCKMTSVIAVRLCNIILMLDRLYKTCKRMPNSSTIAGFLQCNGGNLEEADIYCVLELK